MSYQVLARKWRPRNFAEMVGQEHVLQALINALDGDRLHHAYLFTGTRGVGKTTIARIFAKSLNCESGISSQPCGSCSACVEINEGRFIDLIEVDAASRTKVEDTRELLDNVQYAPTRGRYKVYLIDEVHMLSTHSFNALLKTLEEPPPHIKFLLATTDPQKLPMTILSRCLQFNLKRLSAELIGNHLNDILQREAIESEPAAVLQLAEGADGSMRDGLSLLDQAIAYGGGKLTAAEVTTMLGSIDRTYIFELLQALASGDAGSLLERVHQLAQTGVEFSLLLAELISQLHRLALAQVVPQSIEQSVDQAMLSELAAAISAEDLQLYYQIGVIGRRDLPLAPDPRSGFEMVLLRMLAFRPVSDKGSATRATAPRGSVAVTGAYSSSKPATPSTSIAEPLVVPPKPAPAQHTNKASLDDWSTLVAQLDLHGMARQLAANSILKERSGNTVKLMLSQQHATLRNRGMEERIEKALQQYLGERIKVEFSVGKLATETPAATQQRHADDRQQDAMDAINQDPNVQSIQAQFGAQVVADSVRPVD